jgi:hypothetical protein
MWKVGCGDGICYDLHNVQFHVPSSIKILIILGHDTLASFMYGFFAMWLGGI